MHLGLIIEIYNYYSSRLCFSSRLPFSNEVRHMHITGNGIISMWEELPVVLISL